MLVLLLVLGVVVTYLARRPPEIATYDLDATDRDACEAFVADLPARLGGEARVDVRPDDALGAAYGNPPITVTCGVPVPRDFSPTSSCILVGDVAWYVPDDSDVDRGSDARISTAGYRPIVEVVVPRAYRPQDELVGDDVTTDAITLLSPLVEKYLTVTQPCRA